MEALAISEKYGWARFISEQPPYNLLDRRIENELVPLAKRHQLALFPWSPLAMGILAGRYDRADEPPPDSPVGRIGWVYAERVTQTAIATSRQIAQLAEKTGYAPAQLALRWVMDQPAVTAPIIGPRTEVHLDVALSTLEKPLNEEILAKLDLIVPPGSAATNFFNNSGWMR
jgi:aryl-alcohol dehydrogenase-like predicted oxidoreductase